MRVLYLVPFVALLQGCFFIWIPGSLIQAAADGITGAEGNHCVSAALKVGDLTSLPDGTKWKVESLSGTTTRCTNPANPIRAKLSPAY